MSHLRFWSTFAVAVLCVSLLAHAADDVSPSALKADVEYLASDALEGRLTGSTGARGAARYIESRLRAMGARPLSGQSSFQVPFEFTAGSRDIGTELHLRSAPSGDAQKWSTVEHVRALSFSTAERVVGQVVFAGYGLVIPESQGPQYDSYAGLDVRDKIVLVLRYFPEEAEREVRAKLARYAGLRYKAFVARERGAKALLVVAGPNSPNAGETIATRLDTLLSGSGINAASISGEVADALFAHVAGKTLATAQAELDTGDPDIPGFEFPDVELTLDVRLEREKRTAYNVMGVLGPKLSGAREPWVILGAHYDHLGHGEGSDSLARKGEEGLVHNGADDNASGVAAVLAVGERLADSPLERNVVLGFWSGEELGTLGSTHYVRSVNVPADEILAYVNFDMVGRVRNNALSLQAVGSSPAWPGLIEQANVGTGFDVQVLEDVYLPTDTLPFNQAEIPTLSFFSGSHEDYHRPTDTAEKLNYPDLARVAQLGAVLARKLVRRDAPLEFVKAEPTNRMTGARDSMRAYTGLIPDYVSDAEGLLLSGVREGGPADEAGLEAGDVIVEFDGQTISNIYDYTYALDTAKIGTPVKVVYVRGGKREEAMLTPLARD